VITDTLLFCLLVLLVFRAPIPTWERVRLSIFGLGAILIAVEILRLVNGMPYADVLLNRIVWGSVEVAIAATIATLPTIYILLQLRSKERQEESRKRTDQHASAAANNNVGEAKHENPSQQHAAFWTEPISMETDAQEMTRRLVSRSSSEGSTVTTVSTGIGNRDSWPTIQSLRQSLRNPHACSRRSRGPDSPSGWIELEEMDDSVTTELDDTGFRSEIFVATEINREVHRIRDSDQRPRIITIPRRARLDRSGV
jgi:hypothetical protein